MKYKLMIKIHNKTGLKYLCYTKKEDYVNYSGSGIDWIKHLYEYGFVFKTELLLETDNYDEFKKIAIEKSLEYDIVNSKQWANRKIEEGDGGDTVSNKKWITNGIIDKYIDKNENVPNNWRYGRSNCVFNDKEKQKEFNSRTDRKKAGKSIKKAWKEGKFKKRNLKNKLSGDKNPAKRPEVKEKIRQYQLNKTSKFCIICKKWYKNLDVHLHRSKIHNDEKCENRKI